MAHDFISLAIIAVVAFVGPVIAQAIPKKPIPETVLLLAFGATRPELHEPYLAH